MIKQKQFKLGRFTIIYYIYENRDYIRRNVSFQFMTIKRK